MTDTLVYSPQGPQTFVVTTPASGSPGLAVVVANEAALSVLTTSSFVAGALAFVSPGALSWWTLNKLTTRTPVAHVYVATDTGVGTWERTSMVHPSNAARTAWYIDPQNVTSTADDANDGLLSTTALRSDAELFRRVPSWDALNTTVNVYFLSARNSTDPALVLKGTTTQNGRVYVRGTTTTLRSGTIAAFAPAHVAPKNIVSSTSATPIQVTVTAHGYTSGDRVLIRNHATNTSANGVWIIGNVTANTFTLTGSVGNGVGGATGTTVNEEGARLTDSVGGSWAAYVTGQYVQLTSGANSGARAAILKDLGGGVARVSEFYAPLVNGVFTFAGPVTPAGNETYAILQSPNLGVVSVDLAGTLSPGSGYFNVILERVNSTGGSASSSYGSLSFVMWNECVTSDAYTSSQFGWRQNCVNVAASETIQSSASLDVIGGATLGGHWSVLGKIVFFDHATQGVSSASYVYSGGTVYLQGHNSVQDCAAVWWWVDSGGVWIANGSGSIFGSIAGRIFEISPFGWVEYIPGFDLRARSTGAVDYKINGASVAQSLRADGADGTAVLYAGPYATTFTTLFAPYGSGFNGYMTDIETGAGIVVRGD